MTAPAPHEPDLRVTMSLLSQEASQTTGTGTYVSALAGELCRPGSGVRLAVHCGPAVARWLRRKAPGVRVVEVPAPSSGALRLAAILGGRVVSGRAGRRLGDDADVVHYPLIFLAPRARIPSVVTIHDVQHHDLPEHFSRAQLAWRRSFYGHAARHADLVVTDSEHARERLVDATDVDPDRVRAVHLAVDHETFTPVPGPRDDEVAERLRLPERYVFYPASLWPHKSHARLLHALAAVDDVELLLTGSTFGDPGAIERMAGRAGVAGRVRHLGLVDESDMPVLYRRALALVFPSLYEGFGMPPLEAMACGCPVASSTLTSLAEVCGDAVVPIDPTDVDDIADGIRRVTGDGPLRERLRVAGLERAARFSWRAAADAHRAVYAEAAARRAG